ncbi:MAG TPA: Asp-tRNA(Asn)/Glu-tRNA(Gln) amidotransferase GatCAB subunit B [Alphaproteobacteria bacterium]|nr:Asp-tRNA(Asn)/Glu-tRNA(Gln) amidotransferase GatCAB subunit B [Alphaproteobacteria bacterium]
MQKENLIQGKTGEWEIVIGLEVHAQIKTNSKLFSGSEASFGAEPNTQVSFVDAAMPGMLPVLNIKAIEQGVKTGLAINAIINERSVFDRKNYFYADLPQGYQISQFKFPLVSEGEIKIKMPYGERVIGVERIHIEQDAGKSIHDQSPTESFIDLNRSGVGLMEIVSKPDLRSAEEAGEYVKNLQQILRYVGSCDGDMEKGSMRCDANVSVRRAGTEPFGTRNEIKNLNSIRFIIQAINYEAKRQVELLESGGAVEQATRLFDTASGVTRVMRTKEDAHDYRYFPDPDLYPLVIERSFIDDLKSKLPELPEQKRQRYLSAGLSEYDAEVLTSEKEIADFYDVVANDNDPKLASNWLTAELFGRLNKASKTINDSPVSAQNLSGLLKLISTNEISGKIAKDVLDIMFETGKPADVIVAEKGLKQVSDTSAIEKIIDEVLTANPSEFSEYKAGKVKLFAFFVGQVMKASKGQANPAIVNELLKKKLD